MQTRLTEAQRASITTAIREGRKIEAIKQLREVSGLGLADAKDVVDRLERELHSADPESSSRQAQKRGCGGAVLLVALGSAVLGLALGS